MQASVGQINRVMKRRTRSGQAIILVAFAFIALIAFVGIATDVALLFIRYSTLRRAVDAAAIAAAGQVREGANYLTLNAVAQQFIKVHGIDPDSVRVESCETEIADYINDPAHAGADIPTARAALIAAHSELCRETPQKLIRVTAQVESRTAFLALLGWTTVNLEASAVSQTAVLDVALVLDTSLSESADTLGREADPQYPVSGGDNSAALMNFKDFTNPSPYVDGSGAHFPAKTAQNPWGLGLSPYDPSNGTSEPVIRRECWYTPYDTATTKANYGWGGCCNDPSTQTDDAAGNTTYNSSTGAGLNPDPNWYVYDNSTLDESVIMTSGKNPYAPNGSGGYFDAARVVRGQPDGNYSDLICRPFKDVRDAARRFIKRLDFVRGDRLFLVTFDSDAKQILPPGSTMAVMTDKATAVQTLNVKVGIEVNPTHIQRSCQSINPPADPAAGAYYYGGVNQKHVTTYWSLAQCPDTNTGGGILQATSALVNPNWIRREAVWVMVVLSDGYPNRTPALGNGGIGNAEPRNWLAVPSADFPSGPPSQAVLWQYCEPNLIDPGTGLPYSPAQPNPDYGKKPQYCATSATNPPWGLQNTSTGLPYRSFGFCPWWTFCDLNSNDPAKGALAYPVPAECTENNPRPAWATTANEPTVPYCTSTDPDARHFCMDGLGQINPGTAQNPTPSDYYCDPHYDAMDYARDRVDFAALVNYMDRSAAAGNAPQKGNFIAMYSIFFAHNTAATIKENILGVKMMRYIADAGDNGFIDNHLERWYRDQRDGLLANPANAWKVPPTGLNESNVLLPGGATGPTNKPLPALGAQPKPPTYDGSASIWTGGPYNYPADQDPCAQNDYENGGGYPYNPTTALQPGSVAYENAAKQDCGQFFYADTLVKVNKAFAEIASRLFTRLSR